MKQRIIIVSNGSLYSDITDDISKSDFVIGVDRAAYWLLAHGIVPDVAIGDFDSVTKAELAAIRKKVKKIIEYTPEKDWTDTELALEYAMKRKPSETVIFGGSGTRLDHELGVLHLLERAQQGGIPTVFRNATNEVTMLGRGRTIISKREGSRYVSVLPISKTITISLTGFKYNLKKKTIHRGQTIGISNEFTGMTAEVMLFAGSVFIVQSKD